MKRSVRSAAMLDGSAALSNMGQELGVASSRTYAQDSLHRLFKHLADGNYKENRRYDTDQESLHLFYLAELFPRGDREDAGMSDMVAAEEKTADNSNIYDQCHGNNHWAATAKLRPHELPQRRSVLVARQEWEGYVVEIKKNFLVARLTDLTAGSKYESEEATIPLNEIADSDKEKMTIGSIFRWVFGYELSPMGDKKQVSQIVFRDLPRMTKEDFAKGKEWAKKIKTILSK